MDGDLGPWQDVLAAIRLGEVVVTSTEGTLTIKVAPHAPLAALGAAVEQLRRDAGWTQQELADEVGMSTAAVSRLLRAQTLPSWPAVRTMVQVLGGDDAEVRPLYQAAYDDRRARRASPASNA